MKNVRSNRFSGPGAAEAATTNLFSQEFDSLGGDDTNNENYSYRLAAIGYRLFSEEV
jgi:hypothetical protein